MGSHTFMTPLFAVLLACACKTDDPPLTEGYDLYYHGAWELSWIMDSIDAPQRPPTAQEARTWHVFPSEEYQQGRVRAAVTVNWGERTGGGYWYMDFGSVRVDVSLTAPNGGLEPYQKTFSASGGDGVGLTLLEDTEGRGINYEGYLRVGSP